MKIEINGVPREIESAHLDGALTELGFAEAKVATALNGDFIPAQNRPSIQLREGDRLEVLGPMQGG